MKGKAGESTFSPMVTLALESRSLGGLKHTRVKTPGQTQACDH